MSTLMRKAYGLVADKNVREDFTRYMKRAQGLPADGEFSRRDIAKTCAALVGVIDLAYRYSLTKSGPTDIQFRHALRMAAGEEDIDPVTLVGFCLSMHIPWMTTELYDSDEEVAKLADSTFDELPKTELDKDIAHMRLAAPFVLERLKS